MHRLSVLFEHRVDSTNGLLSVTGHTNNLFDTASNCSDREASSKAANSTLECAREPTASTLTAVLRLLIRSSRGGLHATG